MKKSALVVALIASFVSAGAFAASGAALGADTGDTGVQVTTGKITLSKYDAKLIKDALKIRGGLDLMQNGADKINFIGTFETTNAGDVIRAKAGEPLAGQCHDFGSGISICQADSDLPDIKNFYGREVLGLSIGHKLFIRFNVNLDGSKIVSRWAGQRYTLSDVDLTGKSHNGHVWEKVADIENGPSVYRLNK